MLSPSRPTVIKAQWSTLAVALLLLCCPAAAQTLRIYNIDVEQADSALLVLPNGKTLLIDSGKNGHGQRVKNMMDAAGVSKIDAFVASHYHEDHYGGIDDLVDMGIPVLATFDRGDKQFLSTKTRNQATYKDYQRSVGEDAIPLRRGDRIELDPSVEITCIGSGGVVIGETSPITADEENDMSISLLISFAGFRAYFGGDTEEPTEAKLAEHHLAKDVDFYKSSHHGSHSSSSKAFIKDMSPSVVVISNGSAIHKHPRQVTLNAYAALEPAPLVVQTNKCLLPSPCGNVPSPFIADPETSDDDGVITTIVDASSRSFTVQWNEDSRTIPIRAAATVRNPSQLEIIEVLPDPIGDDRQLEAVTIRNNGNAPLSLEGWILRDRTGFVWSLTGTVAASGERRVHRHGQPMSLNNAGDEISLLDPSSSIRSVFAYGSSQEGVAIRRP